MQYRRIDGTEFAVLLYWYYIAEMYSATCSAFIESHQQALVKAEIKFTLE
jgi:hypothetical protein